ncbi:MAG: hypothetical protein ACK5P5_14160 [Pseudobdellovibrionaceae bacterium]
MNQLKSLTLFLMIITVLSWSATAVGFVTYESFKPKLLETDLNAKYFSSISNYKTSGENQALPNGNSFTQFDLGLRGRYVFYPRWSLVGGGILGNATAQGLDRFNRTTKRTNSSISEISVGAQYFMGFFADTELFPEVILHYPFEKVSTDSAADTLPNSEGVYELTSMMRIQRDLNSWRLFANSGLGIRGDGRSMLLHYGVGFDIPTRKFIFGGHLNGYESLSKDSQSGNSGTGDPEKDRLVFANRVLGGSQKYYAYNPALTNISGFLKIGLGSSMTLGFEAGTSFRGSNAANGYFINSLFSMSFDFSSKYDFIDEKIKTRREVIENKTEAFEENLQFEDEVIEQVPRDYGRPKIQPPKKSKPRPQHKFQRQKFVRDQRNYTRPTRKNKTELPVDYGTSIQDELNDTEFQIQLKQDKNKR